MLMVRIAPCINVMAQMRKHHENSFDSIYACWNDCMIR